MWDVNRVKDPHAVYVWRNVCYCLAGARITLSTCNPQVEQTNFCEHDDVGLSSERFVCDGQLPVQTCVNVHTAWKQ